MNLRKKLIIYISLLIAILITTFITLKPIQPKILEYKEYSIITHFNNRHKQPPLFLDYRVNKKKLHAFFIHPGEELDSDGKFIFNNSCNLIFKFSIKDGSKIGDIEFLVKKNSKNIKKFIVKPQNSQTLKLSFEKGDTLFINANKHGNSAGDWGYLEIWHDNIYQYITVLGLWIIYFIILLSKKNLYITATTLLLFIITVYSYTLNFGKVEYEPIVFTSIYIMLLGITYTIIKSIQNKIAKLIFAIPIYIIILSSFLIPIAYIIYFLTVKKSISNDIINAIFETNFIETYEYLSNNIKIQYLIISSLFITIFTFLTYKDLKKNTVKFKTIAIAIVTVSIIYIIDIETENIIIFGNVYTSYISFQQELDAFKEVKKSRKFSQENLKAIKKEQGETYIVIIGESLNKYHMSLYGYFRDTTPNLDKIDGLIKSNRAYSNYVHTSQALTLALTEANQYNKKIFWNTPSIINILNASNFDTYWLTNQILYSEWDNKISALATDAKKVIAINSSIGVGNRNILTTNYDGKLIEKVKKILYTNSSNNRVIFVHLMGNHIKYSARYPKEFEQYKDSLKVKIFGKDTSKVNDLNAYDNAVYYNDYVVSSILKLLKSKNSSTGFIYLSDHADDVDKLGHLAHNVNKFTFDMTQIPMITWFSPEYKEKYPKKYSLLIANKDKLFSNDLLYDTLIGITNIKTKYYNPLYDLSSKKYKLSSKDALVLHGKKRYSDPNNRFFCLKENLKFLESRNLQDKIFIYANTLAKISLLNSFEYKNFIYKDTNSSNECYLSKNNIFNRNSISSQKSMLYKHLKNKESNYILTCLNKKSIIYIENNNWNFYINQINNKKTTVIKSNIIKYNSIKEKLLPYITKKIILILELQNNIGTNKFINELKKYYFHNTNIILNTKYKSNYDY